MSRVQQLKSSLADSSTAEAIPRSKPTSSNRNGTADNSGGSGDSGEAQEPMLKFSEPYDSAIHDRTADSGLRCPSQGLAASAGSQNVAGGDAFGQTLARCE